VVREGLRGSVPWRLLGASLCPFALKITAKQIDLLLRLLKRPSLHMTNI